MKPIMFLHISKTAGSSLKKALITTFNDYKYCDEIFELSLKKRKDLNEFNLFATHSGFNTAELLNADVITVLRDPVDRITSLYNFWHNRTPKIDPSGVFSDVSKMTPKEFFLSKNMNILVGRKNCQTYQLAYSNNKFGRDYLDKLSDKEILELALSNLRKAKLVGFVEHLDKFTENFKKEYKRELVIPKINVSKVTKSDFIFDDEIRSLMYESVYLDQALYSQAIKEFL